jgi:PIN domain nuclease of toxin-antitoxin system
VAGDLGRSRLSGAAQADSMCVDAHHDRAVVESHSRSNGSLVHAPGGFRELAVTHTHAIAAGRLPAHHRDPFDRMLVAQATVERLTLVTRDPDIQRYDVDLLVV